MDALEIPEHFKERNWRRLMTEMEKGNVIPVIGPELLLIKYNDKVQPLYSVIAQLLSERLEVKIESVDLAEVIYEFSKMNKKKEITEPYYEIRDILKEYKFQVPESLRLLAGIDAFNLFITTSFDDLMLKALNEVRFKGEAKTEKVYYQKGTNRFDINDAFSQLSKSAPVVYHIFGTAQFQPFVVTEDDLLEFGHFWQDDDRRPKKISALLRDKYILILGCNFQNWLSRFFLYTFKSDSLFNSSEILSLIADSKSRNDEELVLFLSRCQTHLYQNAGVNFIEELHSRWVAYRNEIKPDPAEVIKPDSLFLSYASGDINFAMILKDKLENLGINVWFDKKDLESGDKYQQEILKNIEDSSFFLPIISKNVLTSERRFFRLEWNYAIEEAKYRPDSIPFIIPVSIDSTDETTDLIPVEFKKIQWQKLDNAVITDEFVKLIVRCIRNTRRNEVV